MTDAPSRYSGSGGRPWREITTKPAIARGASSAYGTTVANRYFGECNVYDGPIGDDGVEGFSGGQRQPPSRIVANVPERVTIVQGLELFGSETGMCGAEFDLCALQFRVGGEISFTTCERMVSCPERDATVRGYHDQTSVMTQIAKRPGRNRQCRRQRERDGERHLSSPHEPDGRDGNKHEHPPAHQRRYPSDDSRRQRPIQTSVARCRFLFGRRLRYGNRQ